MPMNEWSGIGERYWPTKAAAACQAAAKGIQEVSGVEEDEGQEEPKLDLCTFPRFHAAIASRLSRKSRNGDGSFFTLASSKACGKTPSAHSQRRTAVKASEKVTTSPFLKASFTADRLTFFSVTKNRAGSTFSSID